MAEIKFVPWKIFIWAIALIMLMLSATSTVSIKYAMEANTAASRAETSLNTVQLNILTTITDVSERLSSVEAKVDILLQDR